MAMVRMKIYFAYIFAKGVGIPCTSLCSLLCLENPAVFCERKSVQMYFLSRSESVCADSACEQTYVHIHLDYMCRVQLEYKTSLQRKLFDYSVSTRCEDGTSYTVSLVLLCKRWGDTTLSRWFSF